MVFHREAFSAPWQEKYHGYVCGETPGQYLNLTVISSSYMSPFLRTLTFYIIPPPTPAHITRYGHPKNSVEGVKTAHGYASQEDQWVVDWIYPDNTEYVDPVEARKLPWRAGESESDDGDWWEANPGKKKSQKGITFPTDLSSTKYDPLPRFRFPLPDDGKGKKVRKKKAEAKKEKNSKADGDGGDDSFNSGLGADAYPLDEPSDVAVDSCDHYVVADTGNNWWEERE